MRRPHQTTSAISATPFLLALLLTSALVLPPRAAAQQAARAAPVIEDGMAQVVPAFADSSDWIREELWVETSFDSDGDGARDRVRVAVVRPRQTETEGLRVPVVYESSPYYAGTSLDRSALWDVRQELGEPPPPRKNNPPVQTNARPYISMSHVEDWVPRGFAVVHSEAPGTGLSQGCPTIGGPPEILAPKAVVDWLNGRAPGFTAPEGGDEVVADWTTGKVGMTGTSYNGTLAVAAASTGVEGLEAIIPVAPNTSYYRYYRSHGLVRHPGGWLGEDADFLYDFVHSGDPERRAWCNRVYRDTEMAGGMDRATGDYNDFWAGRDLMREIEGIEAATLMAHAFNDWNVMPEHSVLVYRSLRERGVPAEYYAHQGGHGGPPPLDMMNRWFTRWLHGVDNGIEEAPHAWIVREGDPRLEPTPYPDYPHPDAAPVTLHPTPGGDEVGGLALVAEPAPGEETLVDDVSLSGEELAAAPVSEHRLLYATPPLGEPVHLSGFARIGLRLASSEPAANVSVWLVALPWETGEDVPITANLITRGWADPQNRLSLTESEPLEPGRFYDVEFDLQPDDQVIPAGQRIALMVFSSDRDFTLWPEPGTELTLDLGGTTLVLPVVGGETALRRALAGSTE